MIAADEDALICDFAETYHIYDMRKMSVPYIATLATGLKNNSRIMMSVNGLKVELNTLLLAHIADNTAINTWFKTEDGQKGNNRPPSMIRLLTQPVQKEETGFDSGDDFEKEWRRLTSE